MQFPKIFIAVAVSITDSVYRQICKRFGVALVVTELVSCDSLVRNDKRSQEFVSFQENERPLSIQLFGGDPFVVSGAARVLKQFQPDIIDLNVGCPVPKVTKRQCGAALLRNLPLLSDIIKGLVDTVDVPVTAKIRSGWDAQNVNAVDVVGVLQESGAAAVAIHARTQAQRYEGQADWHVIRQVKTQADIPIIGNGDIRTGPDGLRMIEETKCDAVMVGRGAIGRPWIFREINECLRTGHVVTPAPSISEVIELCLEHLSLEIEQKGERKACLEMRKIFSAYTQGWEDAAQLRPFLNHVETYKQARDIFADYRQTHPD